MNSNYENVSNLRLYYGSFIYNYKYLDNKNINIVEIGVHDNTSGAIASTKFANSKYICYEPSKYNFKRYVDNIRKNNLDNINMREEAITGKNNETLIFNEFAKLSNTDEINSISSSLYNREKNEHFIIKEQYEVKCSNINKVFKDNSISFIDYIISNSEGAEKDFLLDLIEEPELNQNIGQMCIALHPRIYGEDTCKYILDNLNKYYIIFINPFQNLPLSDEYYCFVNKNLKEIKVNPEKLFIDLSKYNCYYNKARLINGDNIELKELYNNEYYLRFENNNINTSSGLYFYIPLHFKINYNENISNLSKEISDFEYEHLPIQKYRFSFNARINKKDNEFKLKIYTGIKYVILEKEVTEEYQEFVLEEEFNFNKSSLYRIGFVNPRQNIELFINNPLIELI